MFPDGCRRRDVRSADRACNCGPNEYSFAWRPAISGTWTNAQANSPTSSLELEYCLVGLGAGSCKIWAYVCHVGSTVAYEVQKVVSFTLTSAAVATGVPLAPDVATPSPQLDGTTFTFNAAATGGDVGTYQYRFYWRPAITGAAWTEGQAYSLASSWVWQTATLALEPGNFNIMVKTRHAGSTFGYEAMTTITYKMQ